MKRLVPILLRGSVQVGLLVCLWAIPAHAQTWSKVATSAKRCTGTSTAPSCALLSTTAGNLGVCWVRFNSSTITASSPLVGAQAMTIPAADPNTNASGPIRQYVFYILSLTGSQTTCSATLSSSTGWVVMFEEFNCSGGGTIALDAATGNPAKGTGSSGSLATASITPTTGALLVGQGSQFATTGTWTAGSGFAIDTSSSNEISGSDELETNLSSSGATTFPATITTSNQWIDMGISFTCTGGGSTCRPTLTLLGVGRCG